MSENTNNPRAFNVLNARNGAVVVIDHETSEILGAYYDRFDALSAIAADWGFCIDIDPSRKHAMGHGFHKPVEPLTISSAYEGEEEQ